MGDRPVWPMLVSLGLTLLSLWLLYGVDPSDIADILR